MLDELDANGLVITKRGKAVAMVVPVQDTSLTASLYGKYRGRIHVHGDIISVGRERPLPPENPAGDDA